MRARPVAMVTLINAVEGYEWTEAPERPDAEAIDRLRAVCREEPRVVELWISGGRWTDDDGVLYVYTAFDLVLDSVEEADRDAAHVEIVPKLEAAWAPTGQRSWGVPPRSSLSDIFDKRQWRSLTISLFQRPLTRCAWSRSRSPCLC